MANEVNKLKNYYKLVEFIKKFSALESISSRKFILMQCDADELLKEIGELE